MAFTEQGIAMLSSVLNSNRAIEVNIAIMRAFVQLRKIAFSQEQLSRKLHEIEARLEDHDESIEAIFEAIRQLMTPPEKPRKRIGFEVKEPKARYAKRGREGNNPRSEFHYMKSLVDLLGRKFSLVNKVLYTQNPSIIY